MSKFDRMAKAAGAAATLTSPVRAVRRARTHVSGTANDQPSRRRLPVEPGDIVTHQIRNTPLPSDCLSNSLYASSA